MSDLISRQDAIDALMRSYEIYEGATIRTDMARRDELSAMIARLKSLPSAEPKTDEESELKFYYVESIDDYWIGRRIDNFYYADWHDGLGFVWSASRYLPWGEHIVDENTLWKEHTYPSEPIEMPFTEWIVGFVKKYFTKPKTGKWIKVIDEETPNVVSRIVAANRDGTYKILVYDGQKYVLFARACVTAFDAYCDSEGEIYRSVSKEVWDSWGKDLPEVTDKEEDI